MQWYNLITVAQKEKQLNEIVVFFHAWIWYEKTIIKENKMLMILEPNTEMYSWKVKVKWENKSFV
jgi:hypothetical protein